MTPTPKHKHTPPRSRVFNLFRTKRQQLGLTQQEVATLMGLNTAAHISEYERGHTPSLTRLIDLAIILHDPRLDVLFPDLYEERRQRILVGRMRLQQNITA